MSTCHYCGRTMAIPFRCHRCGKDFCIEHRLPRAHHCRGGFRMPLKERISSLRAWELPSSSPGEIKQLAISLMIFLLVAFVSYSHLLAKPLLFATIALGFALAFILHELSHKSIAQRYGFLAEFRLNLLGTIISIASIFLPVKILAPGAVFVEGRFITSEDLGKIALAGPLTNIIQAIAFLIAFGLSIELEWSFTFLLLALLNSDLSLFNLLPISIFDGAKVVAWSRRAWLSAFITAIVLWTFLRFFLL
ncbi:MAG: AN1-type zinc finger domain-containing protein [Candidatus Bathyarchaeia archaeon]